MKIVRICGFFSVVNGHQEFRMLPSDADAGTNASKQDKVLPRGSTKCGLTVALKTNHHLLAG